MLAAAHPQPACTVVSAGVWGVAPGCGYLRKCCGGRIHLQRFSNLKVPEETHRLAGEGSPDSPSTSFSLPAGAKVEMKGATTLPGML